MRFLCCIGFLALFGNFSAQNSLKLNFTFLNNGENIALNQPLTDLSGTIYTASDIAFYMSDLKIMHDGGQVLDFGDSVFYVNIRASLFDLGLQNVDQVESLAFSVGVPEHLNHTDISAYPEDHPMYFQTPPMHWGWTAGYTFFLINGMADSDNDQVADAMFELHCLGDANFQQVEVSNRATVYGDGTREIFQQVNIDQWLRNADLKTIGAQHGSTGVNADILENVENYPVFTAPLNAGTDQLTAFTGTVNFSNPEGKLKISWEAIPPIGRLELFTAEGKRIESLAAAGATGSHTFSGLASGAYVLRILASNGDLLYRIKVVQP